MALRAVLFDVGGPLDAEVESERIKDDCIREALAGASIAVTAGDFDAANQWAVETFAPDTYKAIIWRLCGGHPETAIKVYASFRRLANERAANRFELRPGIGAVLYQLRQRDLLLGLAANQPARTLADMEALGLASLFAHREVSGIHGFFKPDPRLFLRACEDLRVEPSECIMVGDRIDNDIAPARMLGMTAVLFRTGRHRHQQPRSVDEVPNAEVHNLVELETTVLELAAL